MSKVLNEDVKSILEEDIKWEKLKGKAVLLTGATGMLGGYILRVLAELNNKYRYGMTLYVMVRNPQKLPQELLSSVSLIVQNVAEPIEIKDDRRFDYVIHCASPASPLIIKEDPVGVEAANVLGAYYTLCVAQKSNADGYMLVSSREIYGQPYADQEVFKENTYGFVDPLDPRSCYPEGKKAAETMCAAFRQQYGLNVKIARLAHTFGPGMSIYDGRVQADFLRNVVNHENIILKSEGKSIRTYTYVADAVSALFYILLNSTEMVYNISSEDAKVSIRELAQTLVDIFPERNLELVFDIPNTSGNTGCAPFTEGILSSGKIRGLGWKPKYTLSEGLKRTVNFLEE